MNLIYIKRRKKKKKELSKLKTVHKNQQKEKFFSNFFFINKFSLSFSEICNLSFRFHNILKSITHHHSDYHFDQYPPLDSLTCFSFFDMSLISALHCFDYFLKNLFPFLGSFFPIFFGKKIMLILL